LVLIELKEARRERKNLSEHMIRLLDEADEWRRRMEDTRGGEREDSKDCECCFCDALEPPGDMGEKEGTGDAVAGNLQQQQQQQQLLGIATNVRRRESHLLSFSQSFPLLNFKPF